ncbi:hypothetical protein EJB05_45327, partial [Eragrostis curvula]
MYAEMVLGEEGGIHSMSHPAVDRSSNPAAPYHRRERGRGAPQPRRPAPKHGDGSRGCCIAQGAATAAAADGRSRPDLQANDCPITHFFPETFCCCILVPKQTCLHKCGSKLNDDILAARLVCGLVLSGMSRSGMQEGRGGRLLFRGMSRRQKPRQKTQSDNGQINKSIIKSNHLIDEERCQEY